MKNESTHTARLNEVALTAKANTDANPATPTSGGPGAPQTISEVTCFHVQANAIREGAANLRSDPDYFDKHGRKTAAGLQALIEAGLGGVWRKSRELARDLQNLTLGDVDVIREFQEIEPLRTFACGAMISPPLTKFVCGCAIRRVLLEYI